MLGIGAGLAEIAFSHDFQTLFGQLDGLTLQAAAADGAVDQVAAGEGIWGRALDIATIGS